MGESDLSNGTDKIDNTLRVNPFFTRLKSSASADNGEQARAHRQLVLSASNHLHTSLKTSRCTSEL